MAKQDQIETLVDDLIAKAQRASNELDCGTDTRALVKAEKELAEARKALLDAVRKGK